MEKNPVLVEFGRNLRAERNRAGLSQERLAEKTGIGFGQHIGKIERGEVNTSLLAIAAIMKALDVSFDCLYRG
ncbi:MAG: helix-turn-helix domain-containing protein [Heliobacteriaceae bacterium]|jgi:transcriptional regulator with XRE-family HTH domain|nr:helix-turn-helix domain-containing protein [Heliobacteriaceae bacterium]